MMIGGCYTFFGGCNVAVTVPVAIAGLVAAVSWHGAGFTVAMAAAAGVLTAGALSHRLPPRLGYETLALQPL
ncbi:MAG: hypothetical protein V4773_08605 [Verrucomicrobiota bacterium]